jgi:peptidoglycan/LPS O-acetylase OafA/YrhL
MLREAGLRRPATRPTRRCARRGRGPILARTAPLGATPSAPADVPPGRLPLIDATRGVAAQLIVLHHLAWYGPLGDTVRPLAPALIDWLTYDARRAVQVFLVLGGFVAALALAPDAVPVVRRPWVAIGRRWLRLAPAYLVAMLAALAAGVLARALLQHESVPATPSAAQVIAHALMLQDVVGTEALTAGAWYVAIDLQLHAGFVLMLWLFGRLPDPSVSAPVTIVATGLLAVVGLLVWGHDDALEPWALHYVGLFALGALAWWSGDPRRAPYGVAALAALVLAAVALDWRDRELVGTCTALALAVGRRHGVLSRWPRGRGLARLGEISYSVFVVHYPVCLVANACASSLFPGASWVHLAVMIAAWLASNAAGALLHDRVEVRGRARGPAHARLSAPARRPPPAPASASPASPARSRPPPDAGPD